MSEKTSTPLIASPDITFAGLSNSGYMTPCSPVQFSEPANDAENWFEFSSAGRNIHWFHGARIVPTAEAPEAERDIVLRFFCHLLVDQIADEGMPEVCQSLREFYDYYTPPEASQPLLPNFSESAATVDQRMVRPVFTIEGE